MIDLAILAGFDNSKLPVVEDGYYLQEMGIDIWRLRDIKPQRILVLLEELKNDTASAERQNLLLENILLSTNIPRANFDVIYEGNGLKKSAPSFDRYATIIIMGQNMPHNITCPDILTLPHLSQLFANAEAKKRVYLALRTLD